MHRVARGIAALAGDAELLFDASLARVLRKAGLQADVQTGADVRKGLLREIERTLLESPIEGEIEEHAISYRGRHGAT